VIDLLKGKKIGVLMGGLSAEREVSMTSGGAVADALRDAGYDVAAIVLDGPGVVDEIRKAAPDVVFIALHGRFGEDGTIQGLLEIMGIPYTGSGVIGSALAMDKSVTKKILKAHGIPTAEFITVWKDEYNPKTDYTARIGCPLVVKPSTLGSTIGMSFVHDPNEMRTAMELAFSHDEEVVVERFIEGREITAGILGGLKLPLVEIKPAGGVYDYNAKYMSHYTEYVCPAAVDPKTELMIQDIALEVFRALQGYGVGRVDFRLDRGKNPYVLEMNTIPGMTGTSLLPKAAARAGIDFTSLCETILISALERNAR